MVLIYVKKQTPEICMSAVKNSGWALQYVKKQTPELCVVAVIQNRLALQYVKDLELKKIIKLKLKL
jgi:hypothetical protein